MADRKRCGRIIGNNKKETAAVAVPQRLGKAFAVYSSRKQCLIIYSKRLVIAVHPFFQIRHAVNEILPGLEGNLRVSEHGAQGQVVAGLHYGIIIKALPIIAVRYDIAGHLRVFSPVNIILPGFPDGDIAVNIGQIFIKACGIPFEGGDKQIKAGSLFVPVLKQDVEQHSGAFCDKGCR